MKRNMVRKTSISRSSGYYLNDQLDSARKMYQRAQSNTFIPGLWIEIHNCRDIQAIDCSRAQIVCKIIGRTKQGKYPFIQTTDKAPANEEWGHVIFLELNEIKELQDITVEVWKRGNNGKINDFLGEVRLRIGEHFQNGRPREEWYPLLNSFRKNPKDTPIYGELKISLLYQTKNIAVSRSRNRKHVRLIQADQRIQSKHRKALAKMSQDEIDVFRRVFDEWNPHQYKYPEHLKEVNPSAKQYNNDVDDERNITWRHVQQYMKDQYDRALKEAECRSILKQSDKDCDGEWNFVDFCLRESRRQRLLQAFRDGMC